MDISVIVPCRNGEPYIERCLTALLNQSFPAERYEVIVVDNMSTDASLQKARCFARVRTLQESKPGSYAARNAGLRLAAGRLLAFIDADCEADPHWLAAIHDAFEQQETSAILGGRRFGAESFLLAAFANYEHEKARFVFNQQDPALFYAYTNNMAVRREVFERCGEFPHILRGGDVVFMKEILKAYPCRTVRFVPAALIRHLEIDRWYSWPRKMWIYGRSFQNYSTLCQARTLDNRARREIFRQTLRRNNYSIAQAAVFFLFGAVTTLAFECGRRFSLRPPAR